jgi:hypothetical protein
LTRNLPLTTIQIALMSQSIRRTIHHQLTVDYNNLDQLEADLTVDIEWTSDSNPLASINHLNDADVSATLNSATFDECLEEVNRMAAESGIDIDEHGFSGIDASTFENAKTTKSRNNVGLRRLQWQDTNPAKPDLNQSMLDKWMELWTTHPNPSNGAGMWDWYANVGTIQIALMSQSIR